MVGLVGLNAWDKLCRDDLFSGVRFPEGGSWARSRHPAFLRPPLRWIVIDCSGNMIWSRTAQSASTIARETRRTISLLPTTSISPLREIDWSD